MIGNGVDCQLSYALANITQGVSAAVFQDSVLVLKQQNNLLSSQGCRLVLHSLRNVADASVLVVVVVATGVIALSSWFSSNVPNCHEALLGRAIHGGDRDHQDRASSMLKHGFAG